MAHICPDCEGTLKRDRENLKVWQCESCGKKYKYKIRFDLVELKE